MYGRLGLSVSGLRPRKQAKIAPKDKGRDPIPPTNGEGIVTPAPTAARSVTKPGAS